ncbi:MAG: Ig-like domain-containing protein [Gemmatimonadaceae bacterium]
MQGVEGGSGRTVQIIATAPGFDGDTLLLTISEPEFRLARLGAPSLPASGGEDPILQLSVGAPQQLGGAFVPMAVSAGLPAQEFTLSSTTTAIALVRFFATASTVGADQGPAASVTFAVPAGVSSTSVGAAASLRMARTGTAGDASVTATATSTEWVSSVGFATATATFTPVGVPRIVVVSGNNQSVELAELAPDSLVVRVLDAAGQPVAGVAVDFTVSANGGVVSPTSATTDVNGRAATQWRVSAVLGTYTVTASRAGYGSAVFTGTVIAGATIRRVAVTVPRTTMTGAGDSFLATATAYNAADSVITGSPTTWSSSAVGVLTVSTDGLVTSVAPGSAFVIAVIGGARDSVLITVVQALDIELGAQAYTAAGLMNAIAETFAPASQAYSLVLRSSDPAVALLSASASAAGTASITIPITAGTASFSWWAHGLEGAGNGSVSVVAEINGVEVDTVLVTVVPPKMRVGFLGLLTLPATGGRDPWFGVTLGGDVVPGGEGLGFGELAVRIGGSAPSFTMTSSNAAVAQLRFRVTPNTSGGAQGPAAAVTFGIQPGFSSTFLPGYDSGELPSIEMSRPGGAGTATMQLTGPAGYTLDGGLPTVTTTPVGPPTITLALVNTPLVGVNGTATVRATLGQPAPLGGLSVTLVSSDINRATVNAPATVNVASGASIADFVVTGVSTGNVTFTATASGYADGTLNVDVSTNTISVPLTLNVPFTRTASLPITLTQPAPVGGTTLSVVSGDPAIVRVATPTVFIAAGAQSGNAQLEGLQLGQVAVTASGPNLVTGTSSVRVTAALDIVEANISINVGFSVAQFSTRLLSGGTPFPAPAGGIPVTFTSRNSACVAAPTGVSVAAGQNSVVATADYGGTAALSCSTYLVATSPAFDADSVLISVAPQPTSSFSVSGTVGAGLSKQASISLGAASPAGGTLVTITTSDPTRMVVSPNATTVGTVSTQFTIPPGAFSGVFWYSGIEAQGNTTAQLTAVVQRFVSPPPSAVTVRPLGIEASGSTSLTTLSGDGGGTVYVGELGDPGPSQTVASESVIRAGGQPVTVTLTSSVATVLVPVVGGIAQNPSTATIAVGQSRATYGIRPLTSGTAQIAATSAQADTPVRAGYPAIITVTQPTTSFSLSSTIGAGLSKQASISLESASPPGGTVITLTSSDPSRVVLASNASTVGTATVDITVPAGNFSASFWFSGVENQGGTTAQISAVAQGGLYASPTPATISVRPIGVEAFGTVTLTTLGGDGSGTVYVGELADPGPSQGVSGESVIRAGGQPIVVTFASSAAGVVLPVVGGIAQNPNTATIAIGQSRANYGIRPVSSGTAQIAATSTTAGAPSRANYPATITVTQPTTSFSISTTVAAGLAKQASISLQSASPPGGTVITLTSSDPSRLVLSSNATTVGTGTLDVTVPAGNFSASFWYAGIENQSGTTEQITGVVQGGLYAAPPAAPITVRPMGVEAFGSATLTTLGGDGSGVVYLGELTPAGPSQGVQTESVIRAGGPSVTVTLTSSTPTVAVPVVAGVAASPRTVTIDPGQSRANYGLRPLVAGTTTLVATSSAAASPERTGYPATITVSSPSSSFGLGTRVGAGLMIQGSFSLQVAAPVGGITTTITSSDPTRLLLAPNATTAGAASITITITQGNFSTSFWAMGLEDVTGNPTVSAQTPGYTDATASIAVEPIGVQWFGASALTTLAADGSGTVYLGPLLGVVGNRFVNPEQVIRFGGVTRSITMTSSDPNVVLPVVGGVAQQSVVATIEPGQSRATVNVRPIGVGTATVAPSAPGLISAESPTVPQAVTVTVPRLSPSVGSSTLGSGLAQSASLSVETSIPAGGRTLTLTSSDPSRVLLAPNSTTLGSGVLNIPMNAGSFSANFVVMALEGVTGTVSVSATIPGYRDTTFTFTVVQGAVTLNGPSATRTLAQGDEGFQAQVGVPSGNTVIPQVVRFGAPASLTVTLISSAPSIGTLVVGGVVGSPATVSIPVGESISTFSEPSRANFRPLSAGNTTVTATIPGFQQQGNAIRTVTVSP